jgi:DNA repair photolyase
MKPSVCSRRPALQPCGLEGFNYQVDPYVGCGHCCHYCYALDLAETDWSTEILVHRDITAQLTKELHGIAPQTIYMGYHTDPYQPCERESRQTRSVLELLLGMGFSASILTKSDLLLRDLELLQQMPDAQVSVSVAFDNDGVRRLFEGNTVPTRDRVAALRRVGKAGVRTGAMVCPVIPQITDVKPVIASVKPIADTIWVFGLSIQNRDSLSWRNVNDILNQHFPGSLRFVEETVFSRDAPFWTELREYLEHLKTTQQLDLRIHL